MFEPCTFRAAVARISTEGICAICAYFKIMKTCHGIDAFLSQAYTKRCMADMPQISLFLL